ncbi:CGNR zinc finger domain-containing protein [Nonomuraea typhae]|uniref:CGNR zinc finger domain-containing protein n=1 Tax=Nonomuraea typhae TaxID=2603600 RepID=A0ABW7Z3U7_9ACTN
MPDPEFPILGTEPLVVELANTLYGDEDFFRHAEWIDAWFALLVPGHGRMGHHAGRVRALRDGVRSLLSAAAGGGAPAPDAVELINAFAAAAPAYLRLSWPAGQAPAARWIDTTGGGTAALGRLATCCVELLAGPDAANLRRCEGPGCSLLFVKNHPRRRWCHPSCGHRDRQARYYRRHLTTGGT